MNIPAAIVPLLLGWYAAGHRELPWRQTKDPYRIWISEIMLQQTRVEAVKRYYNRFLEALPDIRSLADCPEDRLLKLWEGLGYYSRARNLQRAAREIMTRHQGHFPSDYAAIRALPGIGDYTAGAISSICLGFPTPAVDGNVLRVVARLLACRDDVLRTETKRAVTEALTAIHPREASGDFNQALMELGAMVCLPTGAPACPDCPLRSLCASAGSELWREIPVREKKKPRRAEDRTVLLLRCGAVTAVRRRDGAGLLSGVWEFPSVPGHLRGEEAMALAAEWGCSPTALLGQSEKKHIFTHIVWNMHSYEIQCSDTPPVLFWATEDQLDRELSLPTAFRQFRDQE